MFKAILAIVCSLTSIQIEDDVSCSKTSVLQIGLPKLAKIPESDFQNASSRNSIVMICRIERASYCSQLTGMTCIFCHQWLGLRADFSQVLPIVVADRRRQLTRSPSRVNQDLLAKPFRRIPQDFAALLVKIGMTTPTEHFRAIQQSTRVVGLIDHRCTIRWIGERNLKGVNRTMQIPIS
jgi:hypothetical protein